MDDTKTIQLLQQQVQTLQKQVKELEKLSQFIKVTGPGLVIKSSSTLELEAPMININASSVMNLKGSIIKLNNGSKPAARLGSKTAGNQTMQTVVDGSPTVLMP